MCKRQVRVLSSSMLAFVLCLIISTDVATSTYVFPVYKCLQCPVESHHAHRFRACNLLPLRTELRVTRDVFRELEQVLAENYRLGGEGSHTFDDFDADGSTSSLEEILINIYNFTQDAYLDTKFLESSDSPDMVFLRPYFQAVKTQVKRIACGIKPVLEAGFIHNPSRPVRTACTQRSLFQDNSSWLMYTLNFVNENSNVLSRYIFHITEKLTE